MSALKNSYLQNLIALAIMIISLAMLHRYYEDKVLSVKRLPVVGQIQIQSGAQSVSSAEALPLVSFKPSQEGGVAALPVTEDIFTNVVEEKKPITIRKVKKDYRQLLVEKIEVQSVTKRGAILNGRYISVGDYIPDVTVQLESGKPSQPSVVKVNSMNGTVVIALGEKWYTL